VLKDFIERGVGMHTGLPSTEQQLCLAVAHACIIHLWCWLLEHMITCSHV
jgi:hypothetical protein